MQTKNTDFIYRNDLDKACFQYVIRLVFKTLVRLVFKRFNKKTIGQGFER